jgi:hypothetical protein
MQTTTNGLQNSTILRYGPAYSTKSSVRVMQKTQIRIPLQGCSLYSKGRNLRMRRSPPLSSCLPVGKPWAMRQPMEGGFPGIFFHELLQSPAVVTLTLFQRAVDTCDFV